MLTRTPITHSCREKMKASIIFVVCALVGYAAGYYQDNPYNFGQNDAVEVNSNYFDQPSQRLFWGNSGSNQVGGTGWWATLTNKFPMLGAMFGRMQLATKYGVPSQYYGAAVGYQPQYYQSPPIYQQQYPQSFYQAPYPQQFVPAARDVAFTDDAVIVTPPQVPIVPRPVPPTVPEEAASGGYHYNKPLNRLELPHK